MLGFIRDDITTFKHDCATASVQNVTIDDTSNSIIFHGKMDIEYAPEPTPALLHKSDDLVRLIMGPYGSGKTSASIAEVILRASRMPACKDGVRRCRCAVIRNTYAELETTTLNSWDNWTKDYFETVYRHKKPIIELMQKFNDGRGVVELNLMFLALDREEDLKKIKSLEITFAFVNEASEIPFSLVSHLIGRTGRYPTEQQLTISKFWHGVFMDTNPPDTEHDIYQIFEVKKPDKYNIFKQPPALLKTEDGKYVINKDAENIKHHTQGADYYLNMIEGATQEFINVYAMGKYGVVLSGKPVYPQYNDDMHSVDEIKKVDGVAVVIAWDFGLTPACLVSQFVGNQFRVIKEFTTERMGVRELAETLVLPFLNTEFNGHQLVSTCDPTGSKGSDTDTMSCIQVLYGLGLPTFGAITNAITPRVEAVNFFLNRLNDGKPAFIISRVGCPVLRKAFLGKYGYKRIKIIGEEKYRDVPDKSHPYSDIHDCLQYTALYYNGKDMNKKKETFKANDWAIMR